MARPVEYV